ncbi:hypothetical protein [Aureivirga marina]|uniref:hypothetical protein n=1 Tax=Aureivirga marina TaxID=1182451 RepID=UPI0018CA6AA5|nr:hypothetical protein [Aureivirga marina]
MKYFLKRIFSFFIPLVVVLSVFLFYAENELSNFPSTFQIKAKYFKQNMDNIEVLILGSSHNQDALNPELFSDLNVANLAMGGQTLRIDEALLETYIDKLPNLKYVFFELSYHNLEHKFDAKYFKNNLYFKYYDINLFEREVNFKDYSIFLSNPIFYLRYLNPNKEKVDLNKYGYLTKMTNDEVDKIFLNHNYDEAKIMSDTNSMILTRHRYKDLNAYKKNKKSFEQMIKLCSDRKIQPIILMPPVFKSYYKSYLKDKNERRLEFVSYLEKKYPSIVVMDFEQNPNFKVTDFKNDDHLNLKGAEKFSKIINKELNYLSIEFNKENYPNK